MKTKVLRKCLFLLSLCLICPVLSAQTMALSEPEPAIPEFTMEELAVVDTATSYLRNAAYAIYLHDGRDSNRQMTILSLSEQERAALSSAAVGCAALRTTEQTADFPETDISDGSLAAMVSSVELHQKEIAWRAYLHAVSNSSYKYFNPYYRVVSIEVEGAIAVIELYEMLDYQYEELENASFEGNPCLLSLVKVEQGWLVLSVEVDDEFYEEYRNTGFDLEEEIAGQERIREREAQECEQISDIEPASVVLPEDPATDRVYYGTNAKNYALTYSAATDSGNRDSTVYNRNFYYANSASCMLFASQCVWAGFGGSNTAREIACQQADYGYYGDKQVVEYGEWL